MTDDGADVDGCDVGIVDVVGCGIGRWTMSWRRRRRCSGSPWLRMSLQGWVVSSC